MVRIEVDDNGVIRDCECTGNSFGVAIQICGALCDLYHALSHADKQSAEEFRYAISTLTAMDGETWGPSLLHKVGGGGICCYVKPRKNEEEGGKAKET